MSGALFDEPEPDMEELLEAPANAPLAERMRPRTLEEFVGQEHLVGEGCIVRRFMDPENTQSLILWGPPGSGKTTLGRMIARHSDMRFVPFSAVLSGIKEVRAVMGEASDYQKRTGRRTLLFVDEIHRFNKAQQDAFLPYVERGDILLIGATTENPSFEVNSALLSRVRTVVLEPLGVEDVARLLRTAIEDTERGMAGRLKADDDTLAAIARACDGDARRALTLLETIERIVSDDGEVTDDVLKQALQRKIVHYDKSGEEHFNLISALHKSIRNSDADAALYWLARMMKAGEDGNYIARRLVRMATEDIGLADVRAQRVALDSAEAFHRLGYPEGKLALAQAAVYLARTKKSNALYKALADAEQDVEKTAAEPVPLHLRNASTQLMKDVGYGEGYRYAHDDPAAAQEMTCLPPSLADRRYFRWSTPDADEGDDAK